MSRSSKRFKKDKNNLGLALLFSTLVAFLMLLAISLKIAAVFARSSFDGSHRFNVFLTSDKPGVISFSPDEKNIAYLTINTNAPLDKIGAVLKIPIDGKIEAKGESDSNDVEETMHNVLLHPKSFSTSLTVIDIARLWFFTKSLPKHAFIKKTISLPRNQDLINELEIDKIVAELFNDKAITEEKLSIQIVNATGVSGLANRATRLISNMGGNVVLLSTAEDSIATSEILYIGEKTYTVEKLSSVLGIALKESKTAQLSDIIIIIGKDKVLSTAF